MHCLSITKNDFYCYSTKDLINEPLWRRIFFGALVGALLLVSCSGGNKKQAASSVASEELDNASKVINYYRTSLIVLRHVANAKDINAVLGYMEQTGKVPEVSPIAPPEVSARDTAELMDPGDYFNIEVRQNLKQSYRGLFSARTQFYDNFNKFLSYRQKRLQRSASSSTRTIGLV